MRIDEFGAALTRHGVTHGAGVPCSFFTPLVNYMVTTPALHYTSAASEGEAVAIAAGLVSGGRPAFALMQNSGLGNAVNPITSMLHIYGIPVALLISHRGQPGRRDEPQHRLMGAITERLTALCGLRTHILDERPERFDEQLAVAQQAARPTAWICRKGRLTGGPHMPPVTVTLRERRFDAAPPTVVDAQLSREHALRATLPFINKPSASRPAVVATTGKLSRELFELDDEACGDNRFYMVGSMGCAAAFGLGVALAHQRTSAPRKVIVLDGDGSLLMKMGTLATIGASAVTNLHHIVFDNGAHDSTGGQATSSPAVDFASIALACGYRDAATVATERDYARALDRQLSQAGPTLLRMAIKTGARADLGRPTLNPRDVWLRFCQFVRAREPGDE